ncbi:MAG: 23S rRNA (guanosine(2251)-2'-O)-methyltransferase RlmB [Solirubrobacteraceae bacterium]
MTPRAVQSSSRSTSRPDGASVLYGRHPVMEALRGRRRRTVSAIWATASAATEPWLAGQRVRVVPADEIARLSGTGAHQGVCAQFGAYPYAGAAELLSLPDPLIVVLDEVSDPQNLGSICRTAECVGAAGVVIHERRAAAVSPAVCKAAAGAVEHLSVARVRNVADFLGEAKRAGCWCYGAVAPEEDLRTVSYDAPDYGGGVALVLGSEGSGMRPRVQSACDELIALPMHGSVGSLGVSAAAAAILYGILHARRAKP